MSPEEIQSRIDVRFNIVSLLYNRSSLLSDQTDVNQILKDAKKIYKWVSEE